MFGVSAPSSADSLIALAKFVQSPELQARLEELQKAEAAASEANLQAEKQLERAKEALAAALSEQKKLEDLKKKLESLPEREKALAEKAKKQEAELEDRVAVVKKVEGELVNARVAHSKNVKNTEDSLKAREQAVSAREIALAEMQKEHEAGVLRHAAWVDRIRAAVKEV